MQVDTGAFRALTARVDELAEQVDQLKDDAFTLRTIEEMALRRAGYIDTPRTARTGRPRHLQVVSAREAQ